MPDRSLALCKIKLYFSYVGCIVPPSLVILACIDRLMLSSLRAKFRSWSRPRIAYRLIAAVSIFWVLFSSHAFFGSTIYSGLAGPYCYIQKGSYSLFITVYAICLNYLLPTILMVVLGLLTMINVRRTQGRVRPTINGGYMQRKDRYLLRMLLFQVLVNTIFILPLAAFQVNTPSFLLWYEKKCLLFLDISSHLSKFAERCSLANMGFIFIRVKFDAVLHSKLCRLLHLYSDRHYI